MKQNKKMKAAAGLLTAAMAYGTGAKRGTKL